MPEGFQTQLTETANKNARSGAPVLEAYLDESGRLAFRFTNADGSIVPQPRVVTPGFARPNLSGVTPSLSDNGTGDSGITPSASDVLTDFGVGGDSSGVGGPSAGEDFGEPSPQSSPLSFAERTSLGILGTVPGLGLATGVTSLANTLGLRGVVGGSLTPQVQTQDFTDIVQAGREASTGFAGTGLAEATAGLNELSETEDFGNVQSVADLDSTTSLGGSAGDFDSSRGGRDAGPTSSSGATQGTAGIGGSGGDLGGGDGGSDGSSSGGGPSGGDTEGSSF